MKWPFTKLPMKYFDAFQEFWVPYLHSYLVLRSVPFFLWTSTTVPPTLVVSYKQRALSIRTKTSANPRAAPICSEASPPRSLPKRKGLRNNGCDGTPVGDPGMKPLPPSRSWPCPRAGSIFVTFSCLKLDYETGGIMIRQVKKALSLHKPFGHWEAYMVNGTNNQPFSTSFH